MPEILTLVFQRDGKNHSQDFSSRDALLRAANRMIADRAGLPIEVRKNGQLLMAIAALHAALREFDAG